MFVTYFMLDWGEEKESPSDRSCAECGNKMGSVEASVGEGGGSYEGLVCHRCRRLTWLRKD